LLKAIKEIELERKLIKELLRISRENPDLYNRIEKVCFRGIRKIDEIQKLREKGFDEKLDSKFQEILEQFRNAILSRDEKLIIEKLKELEKLV
jgi:hypothetical protein